jgi:hypothetical protein
MRDRGESTYLAFLGEQGKWAEICDLNHNCGTILEDEG